MQHKLVCFIGGGNMAQAIVFGLLKQAYPADKIIVCDPNEEKRDLFAQKGVRTSTDNVAAVSQADVVLLAVKPQVLAEVCSPLSAGISVARLTAFLPTATSIVRVMPNTPALVGEGMAGLFAGQNTSENDRTFAQDLLSAVGKTLWVASEEHMHAVTAASGSSPAYFFQFLEAMQQGLIDMGLSADNARELVQQAMLGSAKMVVENPQLDLSTLRQNVTSKGGTTAAALNVLNQHQFNDIVQHAMQACVARSKEMETLF